MKESTNIIVRNEIHGQPPVIEISSQKLCSFSNRKWTAFRKFGPCERNQ